MGKRMVNFLFVWLLFVITASNASAGALEKGIYRIAQKLIQESGIKDNTRIAVLGFYESHSRIEWKVTPVIDSYFGKAFTNIGFRVVERERIDAIRVNMEKTDQAKEDVKDHYDWSEASNIKDLGEIMEADVIVTGRYFKNGDQLKIFAKMIDVKTTGNLSTADGDIPIDDKLDDLLRVADTSQDDITAITKALVDKIFKTVPKLRDKPSIVFPSTRNTPVSQALAKSFTRKGFTLDARGSFTVILNESKEQSPWWACPFQRYHANIKILGKGKTELFVDQIKFVERNMNIFQVLIRVFLALVLGFLVFRSIFKFNLQYSRITWVVSGMVWTGFISMLGWGCLFV